MIPSPSYNLDSSPTRTSKLEVGRAIWLLRKSLGLTQKELAKRCGWGRSFIAAIECKDRQPSTPNVAIISAGLGITMHGMVQIIEAMSRS